MLNLLRGIADNIALLLRRESMLSSLRVTLVTLAGVTFGGWASAQTAVPGTSAEPFIYPSKGQTAQQEQKTAMQRFESTQGQGAVGAAGGAAGGAIIGAIAGNAGRGAAIGSAVGLLA